MNNSFDWGRFGNLLRRDFRAIWPNFGLTMLIITILPLAAWLFCLVVISDPEATIDPELRWILFIWGCTVFTAMMAPSRLYKTANLPNRGIHFAMLPASKREKLWSMLFYCLLVCPAMVLAGSILFDFLLAALPFGPYKQWLFETSQFFDGKSWWEITSQVFLEVGMPPVYAVLIMLVSYLFGSSVFFFTATLFHKHKVILTLISLWLLNFVLTLFTMPIFTQLVENHPDFFDIIKEEPVMHGLMWGLLVFYAALSVLLLWGTGRRLKNMKY